MQPPFISWRKIWFPQCLELRHENVSACVSKNRTCSRKIATSLSGKGKARNWIWVNWSTLLAGIFLRPHVESDDCKDSWSIWIKSIILWQDEPDQCTLNQGERNARFFEELNNGHFWAEIQHSIGRCYFEIMGQLKLFQNLLKVLLTDVINFRRHLCRSLLAENITVVLGPQVALSPPQHCLMCSSIVADCLVG